MQEYYLKLNESKTEIIVFGSRHFKNNLTVDHITTVNDEVIPFVDKVKYLGAHLDDSLTLKGHVNQITSQCYMNLRKIKCIRSFLSQHQCEILVSATVTSRLDYCNSLFFRLNWTNCLSKLENDGWFYHS